ncbi:MAG: hypothetical protein COU68_04300 [Candidatus Pacebacteria bacterium CG10_big_fil_rev_8_21_14_0_10_45_6]|nr:MAG: hypothetical protein COU68_04300 [Candidatus Pacebacteria bacterium CG10_big_fil_rev_8_21_14_0_10_45_6]
MSAVTIRPLEKDDSLDLFHFINRISKEDTYIRFAGEQITLPEEQAYVDSELALMQQGDLVKLLCFVDDQLAGVVDIHRMIEYRTRKRHVGLLGLLVAKEFRGQGIGKKLLLECIAQAKEQISGLKMIQLECFATNTAALALYEKVGFREVGRVLGALLHKGEYVDEVVMVREM